MELMLLTRCASMACATNLGNSELQRLASESYPVAPNCCKHPCRSLSFVVGMPIKTQSGFDKSSMAFV